jgi:hypothetical protein
MRLNEAMGHGGDDNNTNEEEKSRATKNRAEKIGKAGDDENCIVVVLQCLEQHCDREW